MEGTVITMPAVALRGLTVFPAMMIHFDINRKRSVAAVEKAMGDLHYYEQENALFTGDTLFRGGCGRIDFPTGSQSAMIQSLSKIKQFTFDADVYPGHGPQSKISLEKKNNPYLSF